MRLKKLNFLSLFLTFTILVMGPGLLLFKQAQLCMKMEMDCCKYHESSSSQISELPCCQDDENTSSTSFTFVSSQNLNEIKNSIYLAQNFQIPTSAFQDSYLIHYVLEDPSPGDFTSWQSSANLPQLC